MSDIEHRIKRLEKLVDVHGESYALMYSDIQAGLVGLSKAEAKLETAQKRIEEMWKIIGEIGERDIDSGDKGYDLEATDHC